MNTFIADNSQILITWQSMLENLPYVIAIKDASSRTVAANNVAANLTGFANPQEMIGLKDEEMRCPTAELAPIFYQQDQLALANNEEKNLDISEYADGKIHFLYTVKKRILDQKGTAFIFVSSTELSIVSILSALKESSFDMKGSYKIQNSFLPNNSEGGNETTTRQQEVLFFLLHGKTMKEIAYLLDISIRTVEEHIKCLKQIFNSYSKSQLIENAIHLGYAYIIPASLFSSPG